MRRAIVVFTTQDAKIFLQQFKMHTSHFVIEIQLAFKSKNILQGI